MVNTINRPIISAAEQRQIDVIADHINSDNSMYRLIFEVALYGHPDDDEPYSVQYYLESHEVENFLNDSYQTAVVAYKRVEKYSPYYAFAVTNSFSTYINLASNE